MKTHKDLLVWKKSIDFVTDIYLLSKKFPKDKILFNQIHRSSISIPSNIAEGCARNGIKEYLRFLYISRASASEAETQLLIARKINILSPIEFENLDYQIQSIRKLLQLLINSLKKKL